MDIALFPLQTVLFPGGPLPLRVFEPRYLDMVSACLRYEQPFGVCLIRSGQEVGAAAEPHGVGTLAHIVDWAQHSDGVLGIKVIGGERFRVLEARAEADGLVRARIELLGLPAPVPLPERHRAMAELVRRVSEHSELHRDLDTDYDNAVWVGCRLAELLPLAAEQKQSLLEMDDPVARLDELDNVLQGWD